MTEARERRFGLLSGRLVLVGDPGEPGAGEM